MKKKLALLLAIICIPLLAWADAPLQTFSGSLTATGVTPSLSLAGQSTCSVVLSGTFSGTATFQASSDNGATWNTVTNINGGTATTTGTYGGNIAPYLTRFRVSWTRVSGTLGYFEACSGTVSANGGLGPNPIFTGAIGCNAAATVSPAPSGFNGNVVCAQATTAPTSQPGSIAVTKGILAGGVTDSNCTNAPAVCSPIFAIGSGGFTGGVRLGLDGNGNIAVTNGNLAIHVACLATSGNPCEFNWTCTMSSGACTTTQTVPAGSICVISPTVTPKISTTNLVSSWVTLSSTTLTIHVADELGSATGAFPGNGHCL